MSLRNTGNMQTNSRKFTATEYKRKPLTRQDKIDHLKFIYEFDKKLYGEQFANQCLTASCKEAFEDNPLIDSEIVHIKSGPVKLNLQTDVKRDSGKLMDDYTKQQTARSAGALKTEKRPMLEPKPSEQFMSKAEPGRKKTDDELDAEDQRIVDELLNEKFNKIKKTKRQYRQ